MCSGRQLGEIDLRSIVPAQGKLLLGTVQRKVVEE